jgi:hypothetical protein
VPFETSIEIPLDCFKTPPPAEVIEFVQTQHPNKPENQALATYLLERTGKDAATSHRLLFTRMNASKKFEILSAEDGWIEKNKENDENRLIVESGKKKHVGDYRQQVEECYIPKQLLMK